jgi:hypothetical protein
MRQPIYIVQLGSGLYLDDLGVLHQGAPPAVPSHALPGGVLAKAHELSKLAGTFKDIGGKLPSQDAGPEFDKFAEKLASLGLPGNDMAKLLGVVGKIAGALGTVFVALGAAVAVGKMLGLFDEGPSALEKLVDARFDALTEQIRALSVLKATKDLEEHKNALVAAIATVKEFVSQRDSGTLTDAQIEARLVGLRTEFTVSSTAHFIGLLDSVTYTPLFSSDEYSKVWPWIASHLFRIPSEGPPQPAPFPGSETPVFDHRLAVMLAPQTAQTVLAAIRSLSPEFRTTGDFRPTLRSLSEKLTNLTASIRNSSLARTIYTEGDFSSPIDDFYVDDPFPGLVEPHLKADYSIVVGAMDLCNHNDSFFVDVAKAFGPPPGPSRRGSLDFRWRPPARLERIPIASGFVHADGTPLVQYRILNAKECADAANESSAQDYADILVSSGYMTLVQLAAQLSHATTQPDKSETVHGNVVLARKPKPGAVVTVVSEAGPVIFTPVGKIEAQAWREPQDVRAFTVASTQSLPRVAPLIQYRIVLRTLASAAPPHVWTEPQYDPAIQSSAYVPDPRDPSFLRLELTTSFDAMLDEVVLAEGSSQSKARRFEREVTLKAHTFDWWIPVQPNPKVSDSAKNAVPQPSVASSSLPKPSLPRPAPRVKALGRPSLDPASATFAPAAVLGLGWEEGGQTWDGRHREMQETTVSIKVSLDWRGDSLYVAIENDSKDRNYVLFLVVEEKFGSVEEGDEVPKVLHTAFRISVNGQLTHVPQSLFDEERAASSKQREFAEKFAVSVAPKPGAPVLGAITLNELATDAGVARLAATLRRVDPEAFRKLTRSSKNVG